VNLYVQPMNEEIALQISRWRYNDQYCFYNMDENYIENMITNEYYAVFDEREGIVGYFCLGEEARVPSGYRQGVYVGSASVMDIGIGMRPDLTGKGLGYEFFSYCLQYVKKEQPHIATFRLTVAAFNQRAVKVYKKIGFIKKHSFYNDNGIEFITMTKNV
jgi:[ribosomal protein S18]-alanine N-acetyltransferase